MVFSHEYAFAECMLNIYRKVSACRLGLGIYNGFITMEDFPAKRLLSQIAQWHALCATCLLVGLLVCSHLRFIKLYIVVLTNILNYAKRTFWETILFRRIPLFRERMQILKVTYMESKFSFSKAVLEWICLCNGNGKKWDFIMIVVNADHFCTIWWH